MTAPFVVKDPTDYSQPPAENLGVNPGPLVKKLVDIQKPTKINLYLYGFLAFYFALKILHQQAAATWLAGVLTQLRENTDTDLLVCSPDRPLASLFSHNALTYYQRLELEVLGKVEPVLEGGDKLKFRGFNSNALDCSVQIQPVHYFLHSSCTAFYDLHQRAFLFKDEKCYQSFLRRKIYTPELSKLISQAKSELRHEAALLVRFRTLVFLIRLHLKMRAIGWVLSDWDRHILQGEIVDDTKQYTKTTKINSLTQTQTLSLQAWIDLFLEEEMKLDPTKFLFAERLAEDFQNKPFNTQLLLEERDWDKRAYLTYNPLERTPDHIDAIKWMLSQVMPTPVEKADSIEKYVHALRIDDHQRKFNNFIEQAPADILDYLRTVPGLIKYLPQKTKKNAGSDSTALQAMASPRENAQAAMRLDFQDQVQAQLDLINHKSLSDLKDEFDMIHVHRLNSEYGISKERGALFMLFLAAVFVCNLSGLRFNDSERVVPVNSFDLCIIIALIVIDRLISFRDGSSKKHDVNQHRRTGLEILHKAHEASHGPVHRPKLSLMVYHLQALQYLYKTSFQDDDYSSDLKRFCYNKTYRTEMIMFFGYVMGPRCKLTLTEHSLESLLSLVVEVADHFHINNLSEFWSHPMSHKSLIQIVSPQNAETEANTAVDQLSSLPLSDQQFDRRTAKTLETLASALTVLQNLSKYKEKLPSLVNFIEDKRNDSDLGVRYRIYFRTFDFFKEDEKRCKQLLSEIASFTNSQRQLKKKIN